MKQPPARLVRRWGSQWENWEFSQDASPRKLEEISAPRGSTHSILAVPARSVVAAPIWIKATDPEIVRTSIALELELRGLLPKKRNTDAVVSHTVVHRDRTLVVAMIFPPALPAILEGQTFSRYAASPLLLDLEPDAATFWPEGTDLVVAFTRGPDVVYWATTQCENARELENWFEILVLNLTSLGVLEKAPKRIVIGEGWDDSEKLFPRSFEPGQNLSLKRASLAPSLGKARFEWKPEYAHHAERKSLAAVKARKVLGAMAAVYLGVALVGGLYLGWLHLKETRLKADVATLEKQVGSFDPIIKDWQVVGASAEQAVFPLEILHFVVKDLPESGIRLTTYDVTDGHVVIEGEATSASLASQFFGAVSKENGLSGFHWDMPPPVLLPNSAARFHIIGAAP